MLVGLENEGAMGDDLQKAAGVGAFTLHYQPMIDLRRGCVSSFEALLRWEVTSGSFVSPAVFVPLLERQGLIADVGAWVLQEATRQLRRWFSVGGASGRIAVNVSPKQFERHDFLATVESALLASRIEPGQLELEITEGLLMGDASQTIAHLKALRALGVRIAIDDFGTGYSSLAYLHRFDVNVLKIDRSFINAIGYDVAAEKIITAIIGLAQHLGLEVVAEGVETEAQLQFLQQAGCDMVQGFLLGKPRDDWDLREVHARNWGIF